MDSYLYKIDDNTYFLGHYIYIKQRPNDFKSSLITKTLGGFISIIDFLCPFVSHEKIIRRK